MFQSGLVAADENGNISVVHNVADQERIAEGWNQSKQGVIGSKTREQLNFESAHKSGVGGN